MLGTTIYNRNLGWNPWRELAALDRVFGELRSSDANVARSYPKLDAWVDGDKAKAVVEIPGVDPRDVELRVEGEHLIISGERKPVELGDGQQMHRSERWSGKFESKLRLPFRVESGKVEAKFSHGILSITLPKAEDEKPKKITISKEEA